MTDGTFAKHLRTLVRDSGMSIPDFALMVDKNESTFRSYLSGRSEPSGISWLRKVKRLTGCTWEELLG